MGGGENRGQGLSGARVAAMMVVKVSNTTVWMFVNATASAVATQYKTVPSQCTVQFTDGNIPQKVGQIGCVAQKDLRMEAWASITLN